jgi:RNA polymerase sigma-70 factor (ECF subfamily)
MQLKRYLKKKKSKEALADLFYTIHQLDQLKEIAGSTEAWAHKIAVNQCLATIKKNQLCIWTMSALLRLPFTEDTHLEEGLCSYSVEIRTDAKNSLIFVIEG